MSNKLRKELKILIKTIHDQKKHNIQQSNRNKKMTKKLKKLNNTHDKLRERLVEFSKNLNNY